MSVTRSLTRAAGAIVALAVLAGIAACTPTPHARTAVRYSNGSPGLLVIDCGDRLDSISVYRLGVSPREEWEISTTATPPPADITFLEAPAGWTVAVDTLKAFDAASEYTVSAYTTSKPVAPIYFTQALLERLKPGQVLVGDTSKSAVVISEEEWRRNAREECG